MYAAGFVLLVSSTIGCSQPNLRWDYKQSADFSRLKTYNWLPGEQLGTANRELAGQSIEQIIMATVDSDLSGKGFQRVGEGDKADFTVQARSTIEYGQERERSVPLTDPEPNFTNQFQNPSPGPSDVSTAPALQTVSTITLTMRDGRDGAQIWQGVGSSVVKARRADPQRIERLQQVVQGLLAKFPPPSSKK
jgi:hypothetical protein